MKAPACLVVLLAAATVAQADNTDRARQHFQKGTLLYDLGHYAEAVKEYEEAYQLKNEPALLFNIAQAHRLGGNYEEALRSYHSYLRRLPHAPNKLDVDAYVAALQRLIDDQKKVSSTKPPDAPPAPPATAPATAPAIAPAVATPASTAPLAPAPAPVTSAPVTVAAAPSRTPIYKRWWLWTTVGLVVAAGVGVGVGLALTLPKDASAPSGAYTPNFH